MGDAPSGYPRSMKGPLIGFGLLLFVVGVIAIVLAPIGDAPESGTQSVPTDQEAGVLEIRDGRFEPARLEAIGGTTVTVRNADDREHGIRFDGEDAPEDIAAIGPGDVATFEVERSGRFGFRLVGGGGEDGTLIVGSEGDA